MAALDRVAGAAVPFDDTAGIVGARALAADFVQTVAALGIFVVEGLDKQTGVEVGATVAGVVDAARVEGLRAVHRIELRDLAEGEHMHHHARHNLGDGRTARHVDQRLAADEALDADSAGGVGPGGLHATGIGAGAPGDDRLGVFGCFFEDLPRAFAADAAIGVVFRRHRAFNREDVSARILLHGVFQALLGLVAGGGHQRLGVVERNVVEEQGLDNRVVDADERLAATGALLQVQPDDRQATLRFQRFDNLGDGGGFQTHRRGHHRAEFDELAAGNAFLTAFFIDRGSSF